MEALMMNGYPRRFIKKRIDRPQKLREEKHQLPKEIIEPMKTICIPIIYEVTQAIQPALKPLLLRVGARPNTWKWSLQHGLKDKIEAEKHPVLAIKSIVPPVISVTLVRQEERWEHS